MVKTVSCTATASLVENQQLFKETKIAEIFFKKSNSYALTN